MPSSFQILPEPWNWFTQQQQAFQDVKQSLLNPHTRPITMTPSQYLWYVMFLHLESGLFCPIAYVSGLLSPTEQNYSHLYKEALAIICEVTNFHQHVYVRELTLYTDRKPLIHLFSESKSVPVMALVILQKWALTLKCLQYHYQAYI